MLRVAILENEKMTKEILYAFGNFMTEEDWVFQCFPKLTDFAKAQQKKDYQIVILHDLFDTTRIAGTFIQPYPERVIIFTSEEAGRYQKAIKPFDRILSVNRNHLQTEIQRIYPYVKKLLMNQNEYFFSYNGITVPLKISDIYYIEKDNKYLIYHTKRGEFSERKSMKATQMVFEKYHFLRIHTSFLVNLQHITKFETDSVHLQKEVLPFARARKADVMKKIKNYTSNQE